MPSKTKPKSASQESSSQKSESQSSEHSADITKRSNNNRETCPSCKDDDDVAAAASTSKESWVRCDACKTWFHWRCVGGDIDLDSIDKWFCGPCLAANPKRAVTFKQPARKSSRKKPQHDYASLHSGVRAGSDKWVHILKEKDIKDASFRHMKGSDLTLDWLANDESAMTEPVIIESPDGLGMEMPQKDLTVSGIAEILGPETPVEVMDVSTQSNVSGYTMGKWAEYFHSDPSSRDKIRNVISLEISDTPLANKVVPPRIVRDLDWVENFWPVNKKGKGNAYPKVQLYCLMGVSKAWTDWHVDFAGSSVYYHIFRGSKIFYFIKPTTANLAAYERWTGSDIQSNTWLGDMVDEVCKVELTEGNTMIIPTGWIHAVYTPEDTLVFGGNFLHSYNVATQLKIREIEIATHVPKKYRFPFFMKLCWYVAEKYLRDLKAKEEFSTRVLEGIDTLTNFLMSEVHSMERGTEAARREAREQVPSDRVKDAPALARELRWRIRMALHGTSDDEHSNKRKSKVVNDNHAHGNGLNGLKRKRTPEGSTNGVDEDQYEAPVRHYLPKKWEESTVTMSDIKPRRLKAPMPSSNGWAKKWLDWKYGEEEVESGDEADVERKSEQIIRVRRTENGLERQLLERTLEYWKWEP